MRGIRFPIIPVVGLLLVTLDLLTPGIAHANPTWTTTGALSVQRIRHTATLLSNGQVLVAGGAGFNGVALASAELYDPTTGIWSSTGSMNEVRDGCTATLLPDGRVLVIGGRDNLTGSWASAELYDPATGAWSFTGSMHEARDSRKATLLLNGQVLVFGGESNAAFSTEAELYDPTTGIWSLTGSMNDLRGNAPTATLLSNGQVLVAGGCGSGVRDCDASAELYDPATGAWSSTGSMSVARIFHTATLLTNGLVLVTGGHHYRDTPFSLENVEFLRSAELYDATTGTWSNTGSMNVTHDGHTATLLGNGQVLVAGDVCCSALAELYDPATGTWSNTTSMNVGRYGHTATLFTNGQVLVTGGGNGGASAELFSLDTTAPTLSLPGTITVSATSPLGAVVNYAVSASDPDDPPGQLTVTCLPASGSTFVIGTTTVNCDASDPFSNSSSGSFQVVVKDAATQTSDLIGLVNSFQLSGGLQTGLNAKLQAALNALNAGATATACSALTDFINLVRAQSTKKLSVSQANQLIAAATRIKAVLAC